jgi:hypothetical protein
MTVPVAVMVVMTAAVGQRGVGRSAADRQRGGNGQRDENSFEHGGSPHESEKRNSDSAAFHAALSRTLL